MSEAHSQRYAAIVIPCPDCQPMTRDDGAPIFRPYGDRTLTVCIKCRRVVHLRELTITAGVGVESTMTVDPPLSCGHRPEDLRPAILPCRCGGTGKVTVRVALIESDGENVE